MIGVCFKYNPGYKSLLREQYYELTKAFPDLEVYEREVPNNEPPNYNGYPINKVNNADDLPSVKLVILSSKDAREIKGTINLKDFTHPKNVIYYFGDDQGSLTQDKIGNTTDYDIVYIPIDHSIWSSQAMAIVLYDRKIKNG